MSILRDFLRNSLFFYLNFVISSLDSLYLVSITLGIMAFIGQQRQQIITGPKPVYFENEQDVEYVPTPSSAFFLLFRRVPLFGRTPDTFLLSLSSRSLSFPPDCITLRSN